MISKKLCIGLAMFCYLGFFSAVCDAAHTEFVSYGSHDVIKDIKGVNYTFDDDGEKVSFKKDNHGYLHLYSKKSGEDYLSFIPYGHNNGADSYLVREVHTESPKMTFYEIISQNGDINDGYWLIGKQKGKWVTYVSFDSFVKMGMNAGKAHVIESNIVDGYLILQALYQGRTDCAIEPFWDNEAKWFGLNSWTDTLRKIESKNDEKEKAQNTDVWICSNGGYDYFVIPNTAKKESINSKYVSGKASVQMKCVLNGRLIGNDRVVITCEEGGTYVDIKGAGIDLSDYIYPYPEYKAVYKWLRENRYL